MVKEWTQETVEGFTGSTSCLYRVMKLKDLVLRQRTKIAQLLTIEFEDKIIEFQRMMIITRQSRRYKMNEIGNIYETPMNSVLAELGEYAQFN